MGRVRRGEFDPGFSNASLEEMADLVKQREQKTNRRNKVLLLVFFVGLVLVIAIGVNVYDHWLSETIGALWQMTVAIGRWEWWQVGTILLQYRLSFFLLGIIVGFIVTLIIVFQVVETLTDLLWDWISSLFG